MLHILYEDDAIVVCVKPAGVATQTKRIGEKDMESMLRTYRMQKGEASVLPERSKCKGTGKRTAYVRRRGGKEDTL